MICSEVDLLAVGRWRYANPGRPSWADRLGRISVFSAIFRMCTVMAKVGGCEPGVCLCSQQVVNAALSKEEV